VNVCRLSEGDVGFCGVRVMKEGRVRSAVSGAVVSWYYDPLPTNCVADFVCPGGTGCGYPRFSRCPGPEYGYKNLAVFYGACNFSCLFCQNWRFRSMTRDLEPVMTPAELAARVDDRTTCICYFGGDPTPQIEHALRTSEIAREGRQLLRICFETNGSVSRRYLKEMANLSYESGGCIKFDLKACDERIGYALCFASNRLTLKNFEWLARYSQERGDRGVPFLVASTLLVPGYIGQEEVRRTAAFMADLDPDIPYSLLAFSPEFMMRDMPLITRREAERCLRAATEAGLKRVRLGNVHLLA
jgi:pyruvate formate lyase activating enzyme